MDKIIDILPYDEKKKEQILHAVKNVAMKRVELDNAIDLLVKAIYE